MKKYVLALFVFSSLTNFAQNTFPASGNVGVGTDNPLANLHIKYANGVPSANLRLESSGTGQNASTQYVSGGVYRWELGTGIATGMNFELYDRVNNKSSFVVNPEGFVGIGTVYPTQKLDINGNINMAGVSGRRLFMGGAGGSTFGIAYDINYPNYGIFYTEGEPDYVSISPNGNANNGVMNIFGDGNVGIGSTNPDSKLTVKGKIHAEEVKIDLAVPADYVFEKYYFGKSSLKPDYNLLTLAEVEKFTEENHHLPNVPSAKEIKENGLLVGEMSNVLLQKIEELTLYVIEMKKENKEMKDEILKLKQLNK